MGVSFLLLARRVSLDSRSLACGVVLVEILDEVVGDVQCFLGVEYVIPDLREDELVAAILVVLLQLGA